MIKYYGTEIVAKDMNKFASTKQALTYFVPVV